MTTFNRPHLLNLGLSSIAKQNVNYDFEIIVINDGIKDETENICKKYSNKLNIKYYFSGHRNEDQIVTRNPSIPQNIGIKKSNGDIIVLTCPEIYHLNENGLNNIISPLFDNDQYLTIPKIMYFDDTNEYTNNLLNNYEDGMWEFTQAGDHVEMPFLMGMWKKHAIHIGGYDEDFIGYASDDNDFVDRLKLNGCVHYRVDADIVHLYHGTRCTGASEWDNPDWVYNHELFIKKRNPKTIYEKPGIIIRNRFKKWGEL